jgi:hypothetical protein
LELSKKPFIAMRKRQKHSNASPWLQQNNDKCQKETLDASKRCAAEGSSLFQPLSAEAFGHLGFGIDLTLRTMPCPQEPSGKRSLQGPHVSDSQESRPTRPIREENI